MTLAPVYLDWNATTPLAPEALAEMLDTMQHAWANPSSVHAPGQAARRVLADARARVAAFLGALPSELIFTSGATEANHLAVLGSLAAAQGSGRRRLLLSAVEHPGLQALALRLREQGTPVDHIPVDRHGRLDLDAVHRLMGSDVALVAVMGANNETGVLMPVPEVAALAQASGARLHVDATQWVGKAALRFADCGAHSMAVSAHKIGGPKGVGALLLRRGLPLVPQQAGRQERQRRGGTENLPGIAGFAAACDRSAAQLTDELNVQAALRDRLQQGLVQALPGTQVFGGAVPRLPNTLCVGFAGLDAEPVLARLERAGVVASSGSACSAGGTQPSPVLLAMGLDERRARSGVRFSLGRDTRAEHIDRALAAAIAAIGPLLAQAADAAVPA